MAALLEDDFYFDTGKTKAPSDTPLLDHKSSLRAANVVLKVKPFYMLGGAKGYAQDEPWVDVEDAVSHIWVGGPAVVKRVVRTLALMQATVPGRWVHGTTSANKPPQVDDGPIAAPIPRRRGALTSPRHPAPHGRP